MNKLFTYSLIQISFFTLVAMEQGSDKKYEDILCRLNYELLKVNMENDEHLLELIEKIGKHREIKSQIVRLKNEEQLVRNKYAQEYDTQSFEQNLGEIWGQRADAMIDNLAFSHNLDKEIKNLPNSMVKEFIKNLKSQVDRNFLQSVSVQDPKVDDLQMNAPLEEVSSSYWIEAIKKAIPFGAFTLTDAP